MNNPINDLLSSTRWNLILRWIRQRSPFIFRFCICLLISVFFLRNDEVSNYDQRFQLRGPQKVSDQIVLILIRPIDFQATQAHRLNSMVNFDEINPSTEDMYWDHSKWQNFLKILLSANPQSVSIAIEFNQLNNSKPFRGTEDRVFLDPRLFWAVPSKDRVEKSHWPFANEDQSNIGHIDLIKDEDGMVRRIMTEPQNIPLLPELGTGRFFPSQKSYHLINFRSEKNLFKTFYWSQIVNRQVALSDLKNKIIFVGTEGMSSPRDLTPLGVQLRLQILAQIADNLIAKRWIQRIDHKLALMYLFGVAALCVLIITQFPQSVSIFLFVWIAALASALSAWIFDSFYFWIPAVSVAVSLGLIWIIFVGYQVSRIERKNFLLQQEQKYLHELEQLKNNFVSLISHDLKTPLAKIQAVTDRLLTSLPKEQLQDIISVKNYSEELQKYIQSILQILRVESRDFKLNKEVADINEVIELVVKQLTPLAQEKNIEIQTDLEPLFAAEFDKTLLKEVILNLIENSIKYSNQKTSIFVKSWEEKDHLHVQVKDQGSGIAPEEKDNLWKKFVRGKGQDLKTKGSGLGLYLVKYFVELHGGQVVMESELGKGTTMTFNLPLAQEEASPSYQETL